MNDSDLDKLLHEWTAPAVPEDTFRREVWQRIASLDATPPFWARWLDVLLRPRMAAAGIAVALAAGVAAGSAHTLVKLRYSNDAADATAEYFRSINPFDAAHLDHAAHGK